MKFCSRNTILKKIYISLGGATSVEEGKRAVARATLAPSCARPCHLSYSLTVWHCTQKLLNWTLWWMKVLRPPPLSCVCVVCMCMHVCFMEMRCNWLLDQYGLANKLAAHTDTDLDTHTHTHTHTHTDRQTHRHTYAYTHTHTICWLLGGPFSSQMLIKLNEYLESKLEVGIQNHNLIGHDTGIGPRNDTGKWKIYHSCLKKFNVILLHCFSVEIEPQYTPTSTHLMWA